MRCVAIQFFSIMKFLLPPICSNILIIKKLRTQKLSPFFDVFLGAGLPKFFLISALKHLALVLVVQSNVF